MCVPAVRALHGLAVKGSSWWIACPVFPLLAEPKEAESISSAGAGAQDAMLRLLDVSARCGLPLDPLADSCLKAVARSQVG